MIQIPVGPYGSGDPLLKNTRPAVIDADSLAWIIGYNYKDSDDAIDEILEKTDDFIHSILQATQSQLYIGVLSGKGEAVLNFRAEIAKTKVYKGNRPEKPEWYRKWAPVVEQKLVNDWKFIRCETNIEADDLVASLMNRLNTFESCNPICCGNDKDLLQISGHHYNFVKNAGQFIDSGKAAYNLFYQVLTGDSTDNIGGLKSCGDIGATTILSDPNLDQLNYHVGVLYAFTNKLGIDLGIQSFYENYMLCKLRTELDLSGYGLQTYNLEANAVREFVQKEEQIEEVEFNPNPEAGELFSAD